MLFGNLEEIIQAIGVLGIAAIIFAECGMMVGFFLPGDTLLFTAGFLVQQNVLNINVNLLILVLWIAAVSGDNVGYFIGKKFGRKLFKKPDSLLFHKDNLTRAEKFYNKYGVFTIIIARFIPVVRTFAPVVAGIGSMQYKKFLTYDILGGLLWTGGVTYIGYFGGAFLQARGINVEALILPIITMAVLVSLVSPLYHIVKDEESRQMFLQKLRRTKSKSKD